MNAPLFRESALRASNDRLQGAINLATPLRWQMITVTLVIGLGVAIAFLAVAPFARTVNVRGTITLNKGVAEVRAGRPGLVAAVLVNEGDTVRAGAQLVRISAGETLITGLDISRERLIAVREQGERLGTQVKLTELAAEAERSKILARISGLEAETSILDRRIRQQDQLVSLSKRELDRLRGIAERGFLSAREFESREALLINRQQQRSEIQQERAGKVAERQGALRELEGLRSSTEARATALYTERAGLKEREIDAQASAEIGRAHV